MKDILKLVDAIHLAVKIPEFLPKDGETHCNQFVMEVANKLGCSDLTGLMANDIVDYLSASDKWSNIPSEQAQALANQGSLVIAGVKSSPHGHVVVISPGYEKSSGRWGKVPSCINVGKDVFLGKGINWAFSEFPRFFVWRDSL